MVELAIRVVELSVDQRQTLGGKVGGFGMGPFGVDPNSASYLLIVLGVSAWTVTGRYLVARLVIADAAILLTLTPLLVPPYPFYR